MKESTTDGMRSSPGLGSQEATECTVVTHDRRVTLALGALLAVGLAAPGLAPAARLAGGGNARTDCYANLEVEGIDAATTARVATCGTARSSPRRW